MPKDFKHALNRFSLRGSLRRFVASGFVACFAAVVLGTTAARAESPSTRPTDAVNDFILSAATTSPAATSPPAVAPTTGPATPFVAQPDPTARHGTFTFSDGTTATGTVTTTLDKPLRVWVESRGEFVDVPFTRVKSAAAEVLWERDDPEYQFLVSGSDVKTFTGRTYPSRETTYTLTLMDGRTVKGSIVAPFDLRTANGEERLIVLHKRDKGETGRTLRELVYVTKLELQD